MASRVSSGSRDVALVVFPLAAVILGDSLIYVVLPVSIAEFGITDTFGFSQAFWIGLALSANRFIRLASNSFAARTYRSLGFRGPFIAATLLGASTTLVYGFSRGVLVLLVARALWGIAYSHLRLAVYIVTFEVGRSGNRGKLLGLFNSGQRVGSFAAVTLGALLFDLTTRGVAFSVLAAIGLVGVLVAIRAPAFKIAQSPARNATLQPPVPEHRARVWDTLVSGAAHASARARWRMLSISVLRFSTAFAANGLVISTMSPYLAELFAEDATVFGITVSVITLAGVLVGVRWFTNLALGVPLGHLSDVIGRRRTVIGGIALMLGALALVGLAPSPESVVLALPVLFISGAALETALDVSMGEVAPPRIRASAMARYATWLDLGAATGPIVGFLVGDAFGFAAGYGIAVGVVFAGVTGYIAATWRPLEETRMASAG